MEEEKEEEEKEEEEEEEEEEEAQGTEAWYRRKHERQGVGNSTKHTQIR